MLLAYRISCRGGTHRGGDAWQRMGSVTVALGPHPPRYTFPMNRTINRASGLLLALALLAFVRPATAATHLDELLACRHIAASAARLTCFDRASAALVRATTPSPSPASSSMPVRAQPTQAMKEALDPHRTFGLPHATVVQREAAAAGIQVRDAPNITARIVGMGQRPRWSRHPQPRQRTGLGATRGRRH